MCDGLSGGSVAAALAEPGAGAGAPPAAGGGALREDDKRLFPEPFTEKGSFKEFAEEFLDWVEDRDEEMCETLKCRLRHLEICRNIL